MKNILFVLFTLCSGLFAQSQPITFESLLKEMADRDRLAQWPQAEYKCLQASSYDRESDNPSPDDGKFRPESGRDWGKGWFANHDFTNFIRTEENHGRKEDVLLDVKGPGAIVRFWNALGGKAYDYSGIVRIYLDGNEIPVLEMYGKNLVGSNGLVSEPFSYCAPKEAETPTWRGRNLVLPIPYQESCKITYDGSQKYAHLPGWDGYYYQINYRSYVEGTRVESFNLEKIQSAKELIGETGKKMLESDRAENNLETINKTNLVLESGKSITFKVKGQRAIKQLSLKLIAENQKQALRSTVLEISFDGKQTVWCPVGQFYGIGYQQLEHQTFYTKTDSAGLMTAFWTMPFQKNAEIKIHNVGDQIVLLPQIEIKHDEWQWSERSMYFNATWREYRNIKTEVKKDANFVSIKGKGVFVGDNLTLFNTFPDWWGEGDEKIFVDGEKFPSHFGTGTEDYYCYAWCRPQVFSYPLISQPSGGGNKTVGITINNRYRALDAIPFNTSFHFDMEIWHPFYSMLNYSPATFWYALGEAEHNVKPNPEAAKLPVALTKDDVVKKSVK